MKKNKIKLILFLLVILFLLIICFLFFKPKSKINKINYKKISSFNINKDELTCKSQDCPIGRISLGGKLVNASYSVIGNSFYIKMDNKVCNNYEYNNLIYIKTIGNYVLIKFKQKNVSEMDDIIEDINYEFLDNSCSIVEFSNLKNINMNEVE